MLCDDGGMVAKVNQAESHMIILDTIYLREHIVFKRGVFLVTRQADDQRTPEFLLISIKISTNWIKTLTF